MSKMSDYQNGRMDGLLLAEKIVKERGLGGLQDEIRFRGVSGVHTQLASKELDKAGEQIKANILDTVLTMSVMVLHDEFDFGKKRCQRFLDRAEKMSDGLLHDMATWDDFRQTIKEEMGIEISSRDDTGRVSFKKQG